MQESLESVTEIINAHQDEFYDYLRLDSVSTQIDRFYPL